MRVCKLRWRRLLWGLASTLVLTGACVAQDKTYDIQRYQLRIEPDFLNKTVELQCVIRVDNPGLATDFSFGLTNAYDSVQATSPESPIELKRIQGGVQLTAAKPARKMTLVFSLKGSLGKSNGEDREIVEDESLFLLWSDRFYPISFDDWATVETAIALPQRFQVVAPGKLVRQQREGERMLHTFRTSHPTVAFSVFADSRWVETKRRVRGFDIRTLLHPESQKFADQIFSTSGEILSFYAEMFGPYRFDGFGFVTLTGMPGRRAFRGFVGYDPAYLEREFTTTGHDAHETALLWWGSTLRGSGPGSFQWTEGFGDYAEILYDERYAKPVPQIVRFFREKYLAIPPEKDLLYTELRGNSNQALLHGKYPWLMHLIRYVIGDAAFRRGMRRLFARYTFRTFTMDEFLVTFESASGQSLQWFREEWLERRGRPHLRLQAEISEANGSYRVSGSLRQIGNLYHLPIEIGIETESGMRIERVAIAREEEVFSFVVRDRPIRVVLDPHGWILIQKTGP